MDRKQLKNIQNAYSKNELESMLKPNSDLSANERLKETIRLKRLRRSGMHNLKYNLQNEMKKHLPNNAVAKKSRLEQVVESVSKTKLRKMHASHVNIDSEEYARCLGILNEYLHLNDSVTSIEQIAVNEKIVKDNVRNIVNKIAYYEHYCTFNENLEELEL